MEYMYANSAAGGALAMAYCPMQVWRQVYDPNAGFNKGTVFAELDKPFRGREECPK